MKKLFPFLCIMLMSCTHHNTTENTTNTNTTTENNQHISSLALGEINGQRSEKLHRKRWEPITGVQCDKTNTENTPLKENADQIIDIRMTSLNKWAQEYDTDKTFSTIKELEEFIQSYQLPSDAKNKEIHFYIRNKYLLSLSQETQINYYSPKIIKQIFDIIASKPEVLEHIIVDVDLPLLCQLEPNFLAQFRINE